MDNVRVILWVTFLALLWLVYTTWTNEHTPATTIAPTGLANGDVTPAQPTSNDAPPALGEPPAQNGGAANSVAAQPGAQPAASDLVHVRTDVLDVTIDLRGGDLVRADLLAYPVSKHEPDKLVRLLDYAPDTRWVFQTGVLSADGRGGPTHQERFRSSAAEYRLAPGEDSVVVTLDWAGDGAVAAQKVYTFRRGEYAVDLELKATAGPGTTWRGAPYAQMTRLYHAVKRSYTSVDSYSVQGPALYDGNSFTKPAFDDLATAPQKLEGVKGGWFAAIQHHFVAAAVPPTADAVTYEAKTRGQDFVLSALAPIATVDAAMPLDYRFTLFVGPKLQDQLKAAGPKLDRTVDYGRLYFLAQPLFFVLSTIEKFVNNWGWAIVICTILIKLVFYRLTAMSGRSMAKMRRLAPRMKALQERYKEDRQALSREMMELYKKEKVNPAAGCLPVLIQMPFFFAFYWVLIESVEMRQAPFALWIDDLSARDPFYVLPLLMGVAMFFQTKMSPAPPDPVQARMMQIMPLVFTAFFFLFPSGLVLYWLTNTALSILQQWRINKVVAREAEAAA
jgi:YidC/Oxa1 family membrane protein insertase